MLQVWAMSTITVLTHSIESLHTSVTMLSRSLSSIPSPLFHSSSKPNSSPTSSVSSIKRLKTSGSWLATLVALTSNGYRRCRCFMCFDLTPGISGIAEGSLFRQRRRVST